MTSRNCEEYRSQENGKEDRQENEVRRRKKNFQREVVEENAPEENGISNRLFSSTFIPPLTNAGSDTTSPLQIAFTSTLIREEFSENAETVNI